jgi:GT2 family glycosyltransferase
VVGCNFAVKKETFNKVGYFNERLGRIHEKLISNEETEFFERVKRAYGRIVFEKDLEVYHKVYPNRLTMSYLLRRVWYQGITECIQYPVSTHLRKTLGCFRLIVVYLIKMLINRKNMRYYLIKMVAQLGFIFGLFISRSFNNEDALLGKTKHH